MPKSRIEWQMHSTPRLAYLVVLVVLAPKMD
jgi:hypothetical protein